MKRPSHTVALAAGIFIAAYSTNASTPFLVRYKERLDLTETETMGIFAVYVIGILITLVLSGPASDRYGRRLLCLPFIALSAFASLLTIAGKDSFAVLLLARVLLGVVSGGVLSIGTAWMQELIGKGNEQRAAVATTVVAFAGFGAGALASAVLDRVAPWSLVLPFLVHAALTVLVFMFLPAVPETHAGGERTGRLVASFGIPADARPMFLTIIVPAAIWVFAFPATGFALFPVLLSEAMPGFEVLVAGISGTLVAWAALLARPILARLGARASLGLAMAMGVIGYALGTLAFATDAWALVMPTAILLGGASGTLTAASLTLLGEIADDETRGAMASTFYLLAYPGMTMPMIITTIARFSSMTTALLIVTAIAFAAAHWVVVTAGRVS